METKEEFIQRMFSKGILLNQELLDKEVLPNVLERLEVEADVLVLNSDYAQVINQQPTLVDWYEIDRYRVEAEKERDDEMYQHQLQQIQRTQLHTPKHSQELSSLEVALDTSSESEILLPSEESETAQVVSDDMDNPTSETFNAISPSPNVTILVLHKNVPRKYEVKDFTGLFMSRYRYMNGLLRNRQELQQSLPISRILPKKEREAVVFIGMISEIVLTKTGSYILHLEDPTGVIKVIISKSKKELWDQAKDLVVDEVVGVTGTWNDNIVFGDSLIWPDLPAVNELKKQTGEDYAIFLSDVHVGSTLFLKEEFEKFLLWINGEIGNEQQRTIAANIKYVFIAGDLVDGIGVYPSQESELRINNIYQQYAEFTRLIKRIPRDKTIIICPGNHDVVHIAEPQPALYVEYAPELFTLPNVHLVTNPSLINIGKTENFEGFDILLYHGFSFDYYVANVESIRTQGGYHRADLIMKFLLRRRHLAPSFKSTPYFPGHTEDPLLIKKVPDFFVTGHIHYSHVANYKNVTMISCSCWQGKTSFQEKLGHEPEPGRVPLVNLRTRELKILRFA